MIRTDTTAEAPIEPALAGEEHIRLVTGFADLFAAIVLATGFFAVGGLVAAMLGPLAGLVVAVASWGLSDPLVRQRKFAACGIVLALAFLFGIQATLGPLLGIFGLLIGALAGWQYWRVFKVPIAAAAALLTPVAVTGGLGTKMVFSLVPLVGPDAGGGVALFWGVIVFAIAMYWDISDRPRQTRRSDVGFWLHLAAAPLIVHGAFAAMGLRLSYLAGGHLQPVLILFAALAVVALIVDRRPILVSSLSYLGYAMSAGIEREELLGGMMTVALLLGGGVLVLAVGWNVIRRGLLRVIPHSLAEHLAPVRAVEPLPRPEIPASEKEPVRLIFGFNDIFVAIGLSALIAGSILFSLWYFVMPLVAARDMGRLAAAWLDWRLVAAPALVIWLAAEYFARYRRMALPSIQLATSFAIAACYGGVIVGAQLVDPSLAFSLRHGFGGRAGELAYPVLLNAAIAGSLFAAGANLLFWWRHKVPISVALALCCMLVPVFIDGWMAQLKLPSAGGGSIGIDWHYRAIIAGLIAFAIAMLLDRSDSERRTQRSDIAFWILFLASLLVLPAVFGLVRGSPAGPILVAAIFLGLILLAVAIDRRAPVLVAMPFVINAFATPGGRATVTLIICVLLVATTLGWERLRGRLLRLMPQP